ncbi:MAG: ribose-phosphate diphosphokinase, partial [Candidatus Gracilibacteria bacterium]
ILDSLKRSFAGKVHVVMPYFPYSRQDRVATPREPISAKLIADLLSTAGANHLIALKFHSDQEQGFFNFPVDNLSTHKLFADYFREKKIPDLVVVSPDAGGARDAKKVADLLGANLAIIHKTRPAHNKAEVQHVVGEVKGKNCIIYDDMVDTGGSVAAAAKALKDRGAKSLYFAATHAVLSGPAKKRLMDAGFKEAVFSNTVPIPKEKHFKGMKVLSVAPLLAQIIKNVHEEKSVTGVFNS